MVFSTRKTEGVEDGMLLHFENKTKTFIMVWYFLSIMEVNIFFGLCYIDYVYKESSQTRSLR